MQNIYFREINEQSRDIAVLRKELDDIINKRSMNNNYYNKEIRFIHTEASLSWVVRGCIDYFNKLDKNFLGYGNCSGIPNINADQFANNFYRLNNALRYFSKIFKINYNQCDEFKFLQDIRTIIVHSGEQVTKVISSEFDEYNDMQLGRIFSKSKGCFRLEFLQSEYDYIIQVWADKKDKTKNINYYDEEKNYKKINIYIKASDVRKVVLFQIDQFIQLANKDIQVVKIPEKLPPLIKQNIVENCDFDLLEKLIKNKKKGGYTTINNTNYWEGFGLKKLQSYAKHRFDIEEYVRKRVIEIITKRVDCYYDAFNNSNIDNEDLPSLDVREIFKEYTPQYENKHYFEDEKLFDIIAPTFNTSDNNVCDSVELLMEFISLTSHALNIKLEINNSVDDVICDYFVKSVQSKLSN